MRRALVLSAETPSAVATVRGLHDAGFEVVVLAQDVLSPAAASWRASETLRVGEWRSDELVEHVLDANPDVIVPVTEGDLLRLAPVRSSIERLAPVVAPAPGALENATDKVASLAAAAKGGVAVPEQVVIEPADEVGRIDASDFPMVAKPRRSRRLVDEGEIWAGTSVWCADVSDLREAKRTFAAARLDTVVQRPVAGTPVLVSLLLHPDGAPALVCVHRRVRQMRPDGGPSACAITMPPDPRVVDPALTTARRLGVFGVPIQCEFLLRADGVPVLLDVNPRPWGTLGLALDAGVNFVGWAARHALGDALPSELRGSRIGVVRHYLPFEIRRVLSVWFGAPATGYPGRWPGRFEALVEWGYGPGEALIFRADDPLPAVADALRTARRVITGR